MIKSIRIENADTSSHKVVVKTFDKGANGAPDVLVHTDRIDHPTAMATQCIHSGRYLVVEEEA